MAWSCCAAIPRAALADAVMRRRRRLYAFVDVQARQVDTELAPTWVSGILEVPLSLEHRLKNIEETEAAKKRMLERSGARWGPAWLAGRREIRDAGGVFGWG
jgi:hypothetical protein